MGMKQIISNLNENEILFCERWEKVIKRKWDISTTDLEYCNKLIYNTAIINRCPQCLRDTAVTLNNYYKTILNKWQNYKSQKEQITDELQKKETPEPISRSSASSNKDIQESKYQNKTETNNSTKAENRPTKKTRGK